jgi:hypothetical protein
MGGCRTKNKLDVDLVQGERTPPPPPAKRKEGWVGFIFSLNHIIAYRKISFPATISNWVRAL